MIDFIKKYGLWIVIGVVLIASNSLTGITVNSLSKKQQRLIEKRADSLESKVATLEVEKLLLIKSSNIHMALAEHYNDSLEVALAASKKINAVITKNNKVIEKLSTSNLVLFGDSIYAHRDDH